MLNCDMESCLYNSFTLWYFINQLEFGYLIGFAFDNVTMDVVSFLQIHHSIASKRWYFCQGIVLRCMSCCSIWEDGFLLLSKETRTLCGEETRNSKSIPPNVCMMPKKASPSFSSQQKVVTKNNVVRSDREKTWSF